MNLLTIGSFRTKATKIVGAQLVLHPLDILLHHLHHMEVEEPAFISFVAEPSVIVLARFVLDLLMLELPSILLDMPELAAITLLTIAVLLEVLANGFGIFNVCVQEVAFFV